MKVVAKTYINKITKRKIEKYCYKQGVFYSDLFTELLFEYVHDVKMVKTQKILDSNQNLPNGRKQQEKNDLEKKDTSIEGNNKQKDKEYVPRGEKETKTDITKRNIMENWKEFMRSDVSKGKDNGDDSDEDNSIYI